MRAKTFATLVIATLITAGCLFGYLRWRERQLPEPVLPHVKNASLRVANSLAQEIPPSNITYGELFETLDKHVTELDSKIIDVQTLETSNNRDSIEPVLDYMRAVQDVLRGQQMLYRKQLQVNASYESAREAWSELRGSSDYGYDIAQRAAQRADEQTDKASAEYSTARETFKAALERLAKTRLQAARVVPSELLCEPSLLSKVLAKVAKGA